MESKANKRTFLAIPVELPEPLVEARLELQRRFSHERIRWIPVGQMHLTLRFLGNTRPEVVQEICQRMQDAFSGTKSSNILFDGLGVFSHRSQLRVVWVAIRNPEEVLRLRDRADKILSELFPDDHQKPFRPHLTLARIKQLQRPELLQREIREMRSRDLGAATIDRVVYYESILKPDGPEYIVLDETTLA